jgi:hypothetical protein
MGAAETVPAAARAVASSKKRMFDDRECEQVTIGGLAADEKMVGGRL